MLERRGNDTQKGFFGVSEFARLVRELIESNKSNAAYLVLASTTYDLDRRHYSLARLAIPSQCCHRSLAQASDSPGTYLYASRWTNRCSLLSAHPTLASWC